MIWRSLISALAIVALTLVSFGHRPLDPQAEAQATAYILAGGSFADICNETGSTNGSHLVDCAACILSATCALPDQSIVTTRASLARDTGWPDAHATQAHAVSRLAAAARAPPFA